MDEGDKIRVGVRVRPKKDGEDSCCTTKPKDGVVELDKKYYFDKVFDEKANTKAVYDEIAQDIVKGITGGKNGAIFAYGQTSSGKTHTMMGDTNGKNKEDGIINLAAEQILNQISEESDKKFVIKVSFVEIYNESIYDLLKTAKDKDDREVRMQENIDTTEVQVYPPSTATSTSLEEIMQCLKTGICNRSVGSTNMNANSSRSHSIFKVTVEATPQKNGKEGPTLISSLNLVDLAGSESVKNTGATGERAREGGNINKSLLALRRVIQALSEQKKVLPYRDSKLTHLLLNPTLSDNARLAFICCITPASNHFDETKSTLSFAQTALTVTTHARVNEVVLSDSVLLKKLTKELEELKQQKLLYGEDENMKMISDLKRQNAELSARLTQLNVQKLKQKNEEDVVDFEPSFGNFPRNRKRSRDTWCPNMKQHSSDDSSSELPFERFEVPNKFNLELQTLDTSCKSLKSSDRTSLGSDCSTVPDTSMDHSADDSIEEPINNNNNFNGEGVEEEACMTIDDSKIQSIEKRIQLLLDQFATREQVIAEKDQKIEELNSQIEDLHEKYSVLSTDKIDLESQMNIIVTELTALKETSIMTEKHLESVIAERDTLTARYNEELEASLEVQEQLNSQKLSFDQLTESYSSLINERNLLTDELTLSKSNIDNLTQQLKTTQSNLEESKQMIDSLMNDKQSEDQKEVVISDLESQIITLKSELIDSYNKCEIVNVDKEQLQVKLDEALSGLVILNGDMNDMQHSLTTQLNEANASLEKAVNDKRAAEQQLESEIELGLSAQEELLTLQTNLTSVTSERDSLLQQHCKLSEELESLKIELSLTKENETEMKSLVENLTADCNGLKDLQNDLESKNVQFTDLSCRFENLQIANNEMSVQLSHLEQVLVDITSEKNDIEGKCAAMESAACDTASEISRLTDLLDSREHEQHACTEGLQQEVEQLKNTVLQLTGKCDDLFEQLTAEKSRVVSLVNEVAVAEVVKNKADAALIEAHQQYEQSERNLVSQISDLQSTSCALQSQIIELTKGLQTAEDKLRQQSAVLSGCASSGKSSVNAMTRFNESEITQDTLDAVRRDNERAIETMRAELGHRDAEVSKLRGCVMEWQNRAQIAEQSLNQNAQRDLLSMDGDEAMRKRLGQLQTTVDLLKGERDTIAAKLTAVEQENKNRLNHDTLHIENLEKRLSELNRSSTVANVATTSDKELQEVNQRLRKAKDECTMLSGELASQSKQVDQLTSEVANLKQQLAKAVEVANSIESVDEYIQQIAALQTELREVQDDFEAATNSITSLEESIAELQVDGDRLSSELSNVEQALAREQSEKSQLISQVNELTAEINLAKQACAQQEVPAAATDDAKIVEMESLLLESQLACDKLSAEIETLKEQGNSVINHLNERITELQDEVELLKQNETNSTRYEEQLSELTEELEMVRAREVEVESKLDSVIRQKAAQQTIIDSLEAQVSSNNSQINDLNAKNDELTSQLSDLSSENTQLKTTMVEQEEMIEEFEAEVTQLKSELSESTSRVSEEQLQNLIAERDALQQQVNSLAERYSQNEDVIQSLQEQIDVKDARIQHLDACKLTKDQMEKIKTIKAERAKYHDDCKALKQQLLQLKKAYDELKSIASTSSTKDGPSADYVISDLKIQIVTLNQKISSLENINTQLSDTKTQLMNKLKECSKQLEVYETERSAVIDELEKHGIDTAGLVASLDTSLTSSDDLVSKSTLVEHQVELVDAVKKLTEKLVNIKSQLDKKSKAKAVEIGELEQKIRDLTNDVENLKLVNKKLEKTVENLRENDECERLRKKVEQLETELSNAEKLVTTSSSEGSAEIESLQIELEEVFAENKQLRIAMNTCKLELEELKARSTAAVSNSVTISAVKKSDSSQTVTVGQKRTFGTDLSNSVTTCSTSSSSNGNDKFAEKSVTSTVDKPKLSTLLTSNGGESVTSASNSAATTTRPSKAAKTQVKSASEDPTPECTQQ